MTSFAEAAGAALLRTVDELGVAPDVPALARVRLLARSLQQACAYYECRAPVVIADSPTSPPPAPDAPDLEQYRRIAAAGGDEVLVARLLHRDGAGLIERLKVLRTVFDLSLEAARAADDRAGGPGAVSS